MTRSRFRQFIRIFPLVALTAAVTFATGRALFQWAVDRWRRRTLRADDRGRLQFVDVIMALATLAAFSAVAPWLYQAVGMVSGDVDPFSRVLLQLLLPLFVISMIVSLGVSARTG